MRRTITVTILLLLLLPLLPSVQAQALTPVSSEQANAYYQSCKSKQDPRMTAGAHDAFCACTSAAMMKSMSVEEIETMKSGAQGAREALNTMLLDVYAPCMGFPVQDMVLAQCLGNPAIAKAGLNTPTDVICECVAVSTADWFEHKGRVLMRQLLDKDPNMYDPINPVMESSEFKKKSYDITMACLNGGTKP